MTSFYTFEEAHKKEINEVNRLRRINGRDTCSSTSPSLSNDLIGLSLSGGGIRSASFCVGVMQALSNRKILKQVDIISAVSGGCYALGNFMAMAKHREQLQSSAVANKTADDAFVGATKNQLFGSTEYVHQNEIGQPESGPTQHLRNRTSYLVSEKRTHRLALPWLFAANIAINLIVLLPVILIVALVWFFLFGDVINELMFYHWNYIELSAQLKLKTLYSFSIVILKISSYMFLLLVLYKIFFVNRNEKLTEWIWKIGGIWTYFFGLILLLETNSLFVYYATITLDFNVETDTFNPANSFGYFVISLLLFFGVVSAVFLMLKMFTSERIAKPFVSWVFGLFGPLILWFMIFFASLWMVSEKSLSSFMKEAIKWVVFQESELAFLRHIIEKFYRKLGEIKHSALSTFYDSGIYDSDGIGLTADSSAFVLICFFTVILTSLLTLFVKANHTSLHRFYRSRLGDAFLSICDNEGQLISSHTSDRLTDFRNLNIPVCLINVSANSTKFGGFQKFRKSRRFAISPWACGFDEDYVDTELMQKLDKDLDLGAAVAISGAAASAHMGDITKKHFVVLLALLNIRLGYWSVNPKAIKRKNLIANYSLSRRASSLYFIRELFSKMPEMSRYINLSDGGHSDNLGVLALVKRKCKLIIAIDSEQDANDRFTGLANVIRCARRDHNVDISISTIDIAKNNGDLGVEHFSIGTIQYSEHESGILIYIKSSLTGDENEYVKTYKSINPMFPHEPTSNQFFSEVQFEVYRALGYHAANSSFKSPEVEQALASVRLGKL